VHGSHECKYVCEQMTQIITPARGEITCDKNFCAMTQEHHNMARVDQPSQVEGRVRTEDKEHTSWMSAPFKPSSAAAPWPVAAGAPSSSAWPALTSRATCNHHRHIINAQREGTLRSKL
jgi:hypothetical protein